MLNLHKVFVRALISCATVNLLKNYVLSVFLNKSKLRISWCLGLKSRQRHRQINKSVNFPVLSSFKAPPVNHTPPASASVSEWGGLNKCNICLGFGVMWKCSCVCVFGAGTGPCLHLPSVYIVMCLMRQDHSFVKQHVG